MTTQCEHKNIQQFTEFCLDCGNNIYAKTKIPNIKKTKCKHHNVQDYTETCLDCGKNIWDK